MMAVRCLLLTLAIALLLGCSAQSDIEAPEAPSQTAAPSSPTESSSPSFAPQRAANDTKLRRDDMTFSISVGLAVIQVITLIVVAGQFWQARRAVEEMERATKIADRNSRELQTATQKQLRAYLAISNVKLHPTARDYAISFLIKNYGPTPASDLRFKINIALSTFPEHGLEPLSFEQDVDHMGVLFGGQEIASTMGGYRNPDGPQTILLAQRSHAIYVMLEVRYSDAFGEIRFTRACYKCGTAQTHTLTSITGYHRGNEYS